MSVTLYPSNIRSTNPTRQQGVSGAENIAAFLAKAGSLAAPLEIRGHKDHILAMLEANKDRHVNVLYKENPLCAFCVLALEPAQKRYRTGGAGTVGASVVKTIYKLAKRAIMGKYMTLHVTDSESDVNAHGGSARQVTFQRTATLADLRAVVSPF